MKKSLFGTTYRLIGGRIFRYFIDNNERLRWLGDEPLQVNFFPFPNGFVDRPEPLLQLRHHALVIILQA